MVVSKLLYNVSNKPFLCTIYVPSYHTSFILSSSDNSFLVVDFAISSAIVITSPLHGRSANQSDDISTSSVSKVSKFSNLS